MNLMDWDLCENQFIRKVEIDEERIKSILNMAEARIKVVRLMRDKKENSSFIVEGYYETIKELLVAYMLKHGLRSKNHQCLITFFYRNNKECEFEANLISQLSFFRNRLDYYGEQIPEEFYKKNEKNFEGVIKLIRNLII